MFAVSDLMKAKDKAFELVGGPIGDIAKLALSYQAPLAIPVFDCVRDLIKDRNMRVFAKECAEQAVEEKFNQHKQKHCELVMYAVMKVMDCSHEAKIVRITEVLSRALSNSEELLNAEDFINIISDLSENEAICFGEIYREFTLHPSDEEEPEKDLKNYGEEIATNIERDDRVYLFGRLAGKGLIRERTMSTWDYQGGDFYATRIGEKLYRAIETTYDSERSAH